ncbi:NAD(P)-dependent oxidoreductase [Brachybacterium sp. ACRRE]|uniref:NAD(P)-dependent oxidoreductase n=1 Tax=Brachybacterium sp. ACRRE TaxID=2918184 RepID=UPI001EF1D196|nr:NAD(P)-dependent oxidoreductase [Brachybacterium sp. ACRRE]MCG7310724.1 NAD(P)-dependent oxidoreductase [Brachybacterium sp. ACRRE]
MSETATLGFIGLGNMGGRISRRLVDGGFTVHGHDPKSPPPPGVTPGASAAEVARASDVVLLSLPSSRVVEAVLQGEGGLLENAGEGTIIIDLSTSEPASTRALAEEAAQRSIALLDAGISGGAARAEQGDLTLMVGGDAAVIESLDSVFAPFATHVHRVGDSGAGHTAKLLNNFLNAIALSATSEIMVAARKAGLDLHVLLEVLNTSSGTNFATQSRFPKIVDGDYLKGGLSNALMMKDVLAYVGLLSDLGVASPNSAAPMAAFGSALQLGYGDAISNSVVDAIGDLSGGVRIHDAHPDTGRNSK